MPTPLVVQENEEGVVVSKTFSFAKAVEAVIHGEKVTRLGWNDQSIYLFLRDFLLIHREGKDYTLQISANDMLADDWVVI